MPSFSQKPSDWFGPGFSLAAHAISMKTGDAPSDKTLPQLTDADADPNTGDVRAVMFALAEKMYQAFTAAGTTGQPRRMKISRSTAPSGITGALQYTYTLAFTVMPTGDYEVADEG